MFAIHCPRHGARVLVFTSGVDAIVNGSDGPEVYYHCTCGHRGVWRPQAGSAATTTQETTQPLGLSA